MSGVVLVVEDDRELRELVRRYLERAGHPVHTTASGAEALGLLASDGVELVVLDLGLPVWTVGRYSPPPTAVRPVGRCRWWF